MFDGDKVELPDELGALGSGFWVRCVPSGLTRAMFQGLPYLSQHCDARQLRQSAGVTTTDAPSCTVPRGQSSCTRCSCILNTRSPSDTPAPCRCASTPSQEPVSSSARHPLLRYSHDFPRCGVPSPAREAEVLEAREHRSRSVSPIKAVGCKTSSSSSTDHVSACGDGGAEEEGQSR